jgi:hypothetical protein
VVDSLEVEFHRTLALSVRAGGNLWVTSIITDVVRNPDTMADTVERKDAPQLETEKSTAPASSSDESLVEVHEGRLLRKLDLRLLPAVGILYLLSFLDRSNGMASQLPDV